MSEKYTYADVIIDPEDPRVEIGAEYYFADNPRTVLSLLEDHKAIPKKLAKVAPNDSFPFFAEGGCAWAGLIRKKEKKKLYVPFDLSDAVVREQLWGKRIVIDDSYTVGETSFRRDVHSIITGFIFCMDGEPKDYWMIIAGDCTLTAEEALERAHFYDETPCGRLAEGE